jgi:lipopolysaccharide export system protein LptA
MGISVSVERLRVWLLAGVGLLVMVIAVFLGYARFRAHRLLTELPAKLGMDIQQETNAFTYSQSVQGKTIYTVHAAKAIQHKDGTYTLHDVGIVLYGRNQDRADRIYGNEFDYDQKAGVIRATGEVHIDLQAPEAAGSHAKMDYAAGKDLPGRAAGTHEAADEHVIHVKTSGLVFLQKLGIAATEQEIEFESGGLTGHAVGADYNSDTGLVVLHSEVKVTGLERGQPVLLTASRAELDRQGEKVTLSKAKYVSIGAGARGGATGGAGGRTTAQAQNVVVHLRSDGSVDHAEAEGEVTLQNGDGATVVAPRGEMSLNASNQPQSGMMSGGVKYSLDGPLRQGQGESADCKTGFDKKGHLQEIVLSGAVHLHERVRASDAAGEPWNERELGAGTVDLAMVVDAAGKSQLRDAKATGGARLKVVTAAVVGKSGDGPTSSSLAGDVLTAHFARVDGADRIETVRGDGHTQLSRVGKTGTVNTSSGDSLDVRFRPAAGAAKGKQPVAKSAGAEEIATAVQQGSVVMTQRAAQKPGDASAPDEERATGERAVYDGDTERMTLTGRVQVTNAGSVLWADRVVAQQQTGDATAEGSVKASYLQAKAGESKGGQASAAAEPVHVLATRAELKHDSQTAIFYGTAGRPARLWQGASQVEAPVIQLEQKKRRLEARGDGQGAPMAVHTVLVSNGGANPNVGKTATNKTATGPGKTDVVRVVSRELTYSDEERKAEFTGGVLVQDADGSMRGQQAVVYLQAEAGGKTAGAKTNVAGATGPAGGAGTGLGAGPGGFLGGSVERVVATGQIQIDQPGRRATGEQVVYTASDGMFVLTGTTAVLPKVVDDQRGTVTGTSLRFHAGDESVVVSNGTGSGAGQRVRTETQVKK